MFATDRLRLRAYKESTDKALLIELCNTAAVQATFFSGDFSPRSEKNLAEGTITSLTTGPFHAIIERLDSELSSDLLEPTEKDRFVGVVSIRGIHPRNRCGDFTLALTPSAWGKGYAFEVSTFVVRHAFMHMGLNRLQLGVFDDNPRAKKLYEKVGFVSEGHMEDNRWVNGGWVGETFMAYLAKNWFVQNSNVTAW
ncbi:acyl-CoA N-acyltransferase [Flagelloscypha sp. PMI_526]|nr:acyl-CoA N-acyltransferase [Flagelloscypha sp. PMI_526]